MVSKGSGICFQSATLKTSHQGMRFFGMMLIAILQRKFKTRHHEKVIVNCTSYSLLSTHNNCEQPLRRVKPVLQFEIVLPSCRTWSLILQPVGDGRALGWDGWSCWGRFASPCSRDFPQCDELQRCKLITKESYEPCEQLLLRSRYTMMCRK